MKKIKIVLVDDHQLVRTGIANLLAGDPSLHIIGEAGDSFELMDLLKKNTPDIAILDIAMPGLSGIEITKKLHSEFPAIRILILSMHTSEEFVFNAINAGAKGYLPKNTTRDELLEAISTLSQGNEYFAESISNVILKSYVKKARTGDYEAETDTAESLLSKRELEVLKLFAEGMTNQEIADKLFISIRTVESHKNHIMARLELKTTVDLVKFAIRNHIVLL